MLQLDYGPVPNYPTRRMTLPPAAAATSGAFDSFDLFPPPSLHRPLTPLLRTFLGAMNSLRKWAMPPDPYPESQRTDERAVNELFRALVCARGDARLRIRRALDEVCDLAGLPRVDLTAGVRGYGKTTAQLPP